jgi:hypothetical protein
MVQNDRKCPIFRGATGHFGAIVAIVQGCQGAMPNTTIAMSGGGRQPQSAAEVERKRAWR